MINLVSPLITITVYTGDKQEDMGVFHERRTVDSLNFCNWARPSTEYFVFFCIFSNLLCH
eukprot:c36688_g1_i1 orf=3-179(-)